MERFLQRHESRVLGSISGFDRVLFRGVLLSISYVQGLEWFMGSQRVGFKDFQWFVEKFSAGIKKRAQQIAQRRGRPFLYVPSGRANKEALVRTVLAEKPVKEGLICVLSCVEPCVTFTVRRDREKRQRGSAELFRLSELLGEVCSLEQPHNRRISLKLLLICKPQLRAGCAQLCAACCGRNYLN